MFDVVWQPLVFLVVFLFLFFVLVLFSRFWNLGMNQGDQKEPFLSGNSEGKGMQLKAPHLYWGFMQPMKGFYDQMKQMHSEVVNDYVYWFLIVLVLLLLIVGVS